MARNEPDKPEDSEPEGESALLVEAQARGRRLTLIALRQIEMAHERCVASHKDGNYDSADTQSALAFQWLETLLELGE